jgi:hypothetical protein
MAIPDPATTEWVPIWTSQGQVSSGAQTPWTQDVEAATYKLSNVGRVTVLGGGITVGGATPVNNSINITGQYLINGVPLAAAGVPPTRQVIAGSGMTGGGALSADVTLNANVWSVNGHTGAVVLTPADIAASGGVPATRSITPADGTLQGGGDLSIDRTFKVVADTSVQQHRVSLAGGLIGTRREVNFIQGSGMLLAVTDDPVNNRVNIALTGTAGAPQSPWLTDIDAAGKVLFSAGKIGIGVPAPVYKLDVAGDCNLSAGSVYRINGVPIGSGAVSSVFTRTGAVVADPADYSAFYVAIARQVIAGTGLTGGGVLSADVTLTAKAMVASGASHSAGMVPDPGATAGTTRFLREDATGGFLLAAAVCIATPWTSDIDGAGYMLRVQIVSAKGDSSVLLILLVPFI